MFGGLDWPGSTAFYNELYSYDPAGNTWTALAPPGGPAGRANFGMAALDGIVYICGGELFCTHCFPLVLLGGCKALRGGRVCD